MISPFAILGFVWSIFGLFAALLGMVTFLLLPIIPKITGRAKFLARFYLWLMARVLKRGAFVVSAHGDVLLKKMRFDDRGVETMSFDDQTKAFEDPDEARHYFYGIPFALADEVHGILFDPRHAAAGQRKADHERDDQMQVYATETEANQYNVQAWVRGVFEFSRDAYEFVDLQAMRNLVTGIERAEHPETVETFREFAEEPYKTGTAATRILIIIAAIVVPFVALGIMARQLGGGAAPTDSISFGLLALLISTASIDPRNLTAKDIAGLLISAILLVAVIGVIAAIALLAGLTAAIGVIVAFMAGFVLTTLLVMAIGKAAGGVARLLLKLGFMGYDRPVFVWTPSRYELVEFDNLKETANDPVWYNVGGATLGFTWEPGPESMASAAMAAKDVEARADITADGAGSTNLPVGYARYPEMQRAGYLGGFVPKSIDADKFPASTGVLFSAFTHAAIGIKSHRYLVRAKEKYGGVGGIQDKHFVYATSGLGLFSFIAGVVVFFVL